MLEARPPFGSAGLRATDVRMHLWPFLGRLGPARIPFSWAGIVEVEGRACVPVRHLAAVKHGSCLVCATLSGAVPSRIVSFHRDLAAVS